MMTSGMHCRPFECLHLFFKFSLFLKVLDIYVLRSIVSFYKQNLLLANNQYFKKTQKIANKITWKFKFNLNMLI